MATADNILNAMAGQIVRRFQPVQIILFGSRARGDAKPNSDVDLLVVLPDAKNR
jgi:predicted nucleotidyltransferase